MQAGNNAHGIIIDEPKEFFQPTTLRPLDWSAAEAAIEPKRATRADLVRMVNLWRLRRSQRDFFPRKLFTMKHWRQAVYIARQNKLLAGDVIDDIAKRGFAVR